MELTLNTHVFCLLFIIFHLFLFLAEMIRLKPSPAVFFIRWILNVFVFVFCSSPGLGGGAAGSGPEDLVVGGTEGAGLPPGRPAGGRGAGGAAARPLLRLRPDLLQTHTLAGGGGRGGRGGGGQGEAPAAVRLQEGGNPPLGSTLVQQVILITVYLFDQITFGSLSVGTLRRVECV